MSAGPPRAARPVFVVGSPRSGTSVLTWCLGQHPNLLPVEESNWLDKFGVDLASTYDRATVRGRRSMLAALGIEREALFAALGDAIDALVVGSRERREEIAVQEIAEHPEEAHEAFQIARPGDPKSRWVDGTPEYSLNIAVLRRLFPAALFVHIVREPDAVVRSLMNFATGAGGPQVVASEQEAWDYWLRTVRGCVAAERAYGAEAVHRIRYADLVARPREALGACLEFLGEEFDAACLAPLGERINSSRVPASYELDSTAVDPAVIAAVRALEAELAAQAVPETGDPAVRRELESELEGRVQWIGRVLDAGSRENLLFVELERSREREQDKAVALAEARAALDETRAALARQEAEARDARERLARLREAVPYPTVVERTREAVIETLPAEAGVLVVSRGDDELLALDGLRASHFPQVDGGVYAGHHPGSSDEAVAELERLRAAGAGYVVIPTPSLWWLDHYDGLREHLERTGTLVAARDDACWIYALASP